ncbi:MAG: PH domain-containing protein [Streptosporangiales bacterium]|nr:PH domain-containing protein [Streptosporangiales bacterium]
MSEDTGPRPAEGRPPRAPDAPPSDAARPDAPPREAEGGAERGAERGEPAFVHEAPAPLEPPDEQRPPYVPVPDGAVFAPPRGLGWTPVTLRLTWYRRLFLLVVTVPLSLLAVLITLLTGATPLAVSFGGAGLAISVIGWILADLDKRSWGYCERADEIYITRGVLVRRLTVVSYGRIQLVDVTADVFEQSLGIATVRLSTAAASTDAWIPGLRLQDAILLRDRLADRAAAASMGL